MNDKQIVKLKKSSLITILYFNINQYLRDTIGILGKKYKNYGVSINNIDMTKYAGSINLICCPAFCFYKGEQQDIIYSDNIDYIEDKIRTYIGGI